MLPCSAMRGDGGAAGKNEKKEKKKWPAVEGNEGQSPLFFFSEGEGVNSRERGCGRRIQEEEDQKWRGGAAALVFF